jgi:Domain of unknown function (DUF3536)
VNFFESEKVKLAAGTVEIRSRTTHAQLGFNFAVLHAGGHNLRAGVCEAHDEFSEFTKEASACLAKSGFSGCLRALDHYFGTETYSLKSLFRDERRRIVTQIVDSTLADIGNLYGDVYEHNVSLIGFLRELTLPLPAILRVSSEFVLNNAICRSMSSEKIDFARLRLLIQTAAQSGIALDDSAKSALRERLDRTMDHWSTDPLVLQTMSELEMLVPLLRNAPFTADLWDAQNTYYKVLKTIKRLKQAFPGETWVQLFRSLGESLGIAVPQIFFPAASEKKFPVASVPQAPEVQLSVPAE